MELKEIVLKYFECFSKKNIKSLKDFFSNDVVLKDWEIEANGIDEVIAANTNIFNNFKSIIVETKNLYQEKNIVIGELEIKLNNTEILRVVDIIEFNEKDKIKRIFAFKG